MDTAMLRLSVSFGITWLEVPRPLFFTNKNKDTSNHLKGYDQDWRGCWYIPGT